MPTHSSKTIYGIPVLYYFIFVACIVAGLFMGRLPDNMLVGFTLCLALGTLFNFVGGSIPVFGLFGGGTILAVMGPSILLHFGLLPENAKTIAKNFFSGYDFSTFLIASLVVGSILAMKREILIKAGVRFFVPMIVTLIGCVLATGLLGLLTGYGMMEGMLFVAGPIMGAGIGMAAIPLSEIYANLTGGAKDTFLPILSASIMLANIMTILTAAVLAALGKRNPNMFFKGFSGEGKILRVEGSDMDSAAFVDKDEGSAGSTFKDLGAGLLAAGAFFAVSRILNGFFPTFHTYLWMVVVAASCKIFKLVPEAVEFSCGQWGNLISKALTPAMMAAISLSSINIQQVLGLLGDIRFLGLCMSTVLLAVLIAGLVGYLMGFYFVESAIMAGIGLADMGGTGDIAVLTAANRMHLLPFLTISSRIGGALNILVLTLLAQAFL